jgi:hypothetical protein
MSSADLVLLGGFAGSNEIAQRLVMGIRDPHGAEVAAVIGSRQLLGVVAFGLDAVAAHARYERRGHDLGGPQGG